MYHVASLWLVEVLFERVFYSENFASWSKDVIIFIPKILTKIEHVLHKNKITESQNILPVQNLTLWDSEAEAVFLLVNSY